jgi:beta-glucanase (GH16 family)
MLRRRPVQLVVTAVLIVSCVAGFVITPHFISFAAQDGLLSQNRPAIASSVESVLHPPSAAVDGDAKTRWASAMGSDPQWLAIDFGQSVSMTRVVLQWETAYAAVYSLEVSDDGLHWTAFYTQNAGHGGTETIPFSAQGRYIRIFGTQRGTQWGYSLWEFQVYGSTQTPDTTTTGSTPPSSSDTTTPTTTSPSSSTTPTATSSTTSGSTTPAGAFKCAANTAPAAMKLVLDDEFKGAAGSPPDATQWVNQPGPGYGAETFTSSGNVYLDGDGDMVIEADRTGNGYTSARINSDAIYSETSGAATPGFHFQYGHVEACMKLPSVSGLWPAFWLMGKNPSTWPVNGEIDIMEQMMTPNGITSTMHSPGTSGDGQTYTLPSGTFADAYHIIAADWTANQFSFSVDGHTFFTRTKAEYKAQWVFDQPMYMLFDVAVGGCCGGDPAGTTFPQKTYINYVRVYQ